MSENRQAGVVMPQNKGRIFTPPRLKLLGYVAFFGELEAASGKAAGLDWLSDKAWGAALQAANDHDMESCTAILVAHTSLLEAHPSRAKVVQV